MYQLLEENEDDIFMGSASSKFFEIVTQVNDEIAKEELDVAFERLAALELMLQKELGEEVDIYEKVDSFIRENSSEVENKKKGLYIEYTGNIVCRLDS